MKHEDMVQLMTTDQREFIPFYNKPKHDCELPINSHVRVVGFGFSYEGRTGRVIGYEQPCRGYLGWHWVLFDGENMPESYHKLPKLHFSKLKVIE